MVRKLARLISFWAKFRLSMITPKTSRPRQGQKIIPGRDHWWWRPRRLQRALEGNSELDRFFHWKVPGRKSPDGRKWTREQRRSIETSLWLYELDARISRRYLFGKPAYLLSPENTAAVVAFADSGNSSWPMFATGKRRRSFAWEWIEFFDKRDERKVAKLTRAELNGIIAAMKYCVEYFVRA